jgi:hypothetical protein
VWTRCAILTRLSVRTRVGVEAMVFQVKVSEGALGPVKLYLVRLPVRSSL